VVIAFDLEIRNVTLLTIGGGTPELFGTDIAFARVVDAEGRVKIYIPGSSVKGALRSAASRIAEHYGFRSCGEVRPERIARAHSGGVCDVCELFGYPNPGGVRSPLVVSNFEPVDDLSNRLVRVTHVSIDARRSIARRWALYVIEYVVPGTTFRGSLYLDPSARRLLPLLLLAIAELRTGRFGRRSLVDVRLVDGGELDKYVDSSWKGLLTSLRGWLWVGVT
jgi:CRISPR/Cas system CSM-associated protein Csm3 (group 7 of RAMP superfamily)